MKMTKPKKVNSRKVQKELAEVDKLFRQLEKNKNLPTFGQHFMHCIIFGIAEHVNLKTMYPRTYAKLRKWLDQNDASILVYQKETRGLSK